MIDYELKFVSLFARWTRYATMAVDEENYVVEENTRVTRLFLYNSNASGTGSVRVSAQGLVSIL